jgi:hypothetical protein
MHLVLALKLSVTKVVIRAMLIVGRKPRVDWTFLRTYSLQNYFQSFSFILVFIPLVLFKLLSYSLLFLNFRWFVLIVQPERALDVSPLDSWRLGMYHPHQSLSLTPLSTFLRGRTPSRLWSRYRQEKTCKKLNRCHRTTTTTTIMGRKKTMRRRKKKRATRLKAKMMKTTLL